MFLAEYSCGIEGAVIDGSIITIVSTVVTVIQIVVPIILIIFGMLDFGKAVMAQKEDEIKKGQQTFIKRLIAAALVFFVVAIVRLVVGLVAGDEENSGWSCVECFIDGIDSDKCQEI